MDNKGISSTLAGPFTDWPSEISPNNRAGCSASKCKEEGVKILKGEIRQGVMVTFQDKQSWKYRHWYACISSRSSMNTANKLLGAA